MNPQKTHVETFVSISDIQLFFPQSGHISGASIKLKEMIGLDIVFGQGSFVYKVPKTVNFLHRKIISYRSINFPPVIFSVVNTKSSANKSELSKEGLEITTRQ